MMIPNNYQAFTSVSRAVFLDASDLEFASDIVGIGLYISMISGRSGQVLRGRKPLHLNILKTISELLVHFHCSVLPSMSSSYT